MINIQDLPHKPYTYHYSQPDEYHFCFDSLILPWFVSEQIKKNRITEQDKVLDLCAGCGVIGIELSCYDKRIFQIDFLEIQEVFYSHFVKNREQAQKDPILFQWIGQNYECLLGADYQEKYSLIVSNPPYFFPQHGILSPNDIISRCRFFRDSSVEKMFLGIENSLKSKGQAFILMKDEKNHKLPFINKVSEWCGKCHSEVIANIRGTHLIHLQKK